MSEMASRIIRSTPTIDQAYLLGSFQLIKIPIILQHEKTTNVLMLISSNKNMEVPPLTETRWF